MTKEGEPNAIKDQPSTDSGKAPYVPAANDTYKGASELKYFNGDMKLHPYNRQFPRAKKIPYKEARNMEHIPPSNHKFPQVEDGPAKNTRVRKR